MLQWYFAARPETPRKRRTRDDQYSAQHFRNPMLSGACVQAGCPCGNVAAQAIEHVCSIGGTSTTAWGSEVRTAGSCLFNFQLQTFRFIGPTLGSRCACVLFEHAGLLRLRPPFVGPLTLS